MAEYDHRKYVGTPTGRRMSQPEMRDLNPYRAKPKGRQPLIEVDFAKLELRVLAFMRSSDHGRS